MTTDTAARWLTREPELAALAPAIRLREAGRHAEAAVWLRDRVEAAPSDASAHALLAHSLWQQRDDAAAAKMINAALQLAPESSLVQRMLAKGLLRLGRASEALAAAQRAYQLDPEHPETMLVLGMAFDGAGRTGDALGQLSGAAAVWPEYAEIYAVRALVRRKIGDTVEALTDAEAVVRLKPSLAAGWALLSQLRRQTGDLAGGVVALERASRLEPQNLAHLVNLGDALRVDGRLQESRDVLQAAVAPASSSAAAWSNLGTTLHALGEVDEAQRAYERAVQLDPSSAEALHNLGALAIESDDWEAALGWFSKALDHRPNEPGYLANRALALLELNRPPQAVAAVLDAAFAADSSHAAALCVLGRLREKLGDFTGADEAYRQVLQARPGHVQALAGRARVLAMDRPDEAEQVLRRLPSEARSLSMLIFNACRRGVEPREVLALARRFGEVVSPAVARPLPARPTLRGPRLKVGYVSADFRRHPVSHFIEPLFKAHDRERIEVYAYYNHTDRDPETGRIRAAADRWTPVRHLSDSAFLEQVQADGVDVLIDLSGHTDGNRLAALARRVAPVQAHYLGSFGTTGVPAIDYWIGDPVLTPASMDSLFTETVWRLPRTWVAYEGRKDAPPPRRHDDGAIRVGSFNALGKLTLATYAVWARVLRAVPEARLLLKTKELTDAAVRQRVVGNFAEQGIGPDRLELHDISATNSWSDHMDFYSRLDIALDPVGGVGGGSTSCDALWMGVPLVTLAGDRFGSRMTASMLQAIGADDMIATTEDDYVATVAKLAGDPGRLSALRGAQRQRMLASPLCDARGLAAALEDGYEAMFDRRQQGATR